MNHVQPHNLCSGWNIHMWKPYTTTDWHPGQHCNISAWGHIPEPMCFTRDWWWWNVLEQHFVWEGALLHQRAMFLCIKWGILPRSLGKRQILMQWLCRSQSTSSITWTVLVFQRNWLGWLYPLLGGTFCYCPQLDLSGFESYSWAH